MNDKNTTITTQKHRTMSKQKGFALILSIILLVLIAAVVAGAFYLWKHQTTQIDLLNQYVSNIETQLGIKDEAVKEFRSSLAKLSAETQSQDVILSDHLRALEDDLGDVNKRVTHMERSISSENWLLSEVEYLLKMADQRILIKEDVKGALLLMRKAEKLIREIPVDDPGLMNVLVAISKDIVLMEM